MTSHLTSAHLPPFPSLSYLLPPSQNYLECLWQRQIAVCRATTKPSALHASCHRRFISCREKHPAEPSVCEDVAEQQTDGRQLEGASLWLITSAESATIPQRFINLEVFTLFCCCCKDQRAAYGNEGAGLALAISRSRS